MPILAQLPPTDLTPWGMFQSADIVVKAVMVGLLLASVATWTILLVKTVELIAARRALRVAIAATEATRALDGLELTGNAGGFVAATRAEIAASQGLPAEGIKERIAARLQRAEAALGRRMTRGTGVLASIGATAPFIGLSGTVWGIMNSFVGISRAQTTNLAVVAPAIAEALLATAFGLFAAIPAVVIYNIFARAIGGYRAQLADLCAAILALAGRDLDRRLVERKPAAIGPVRLHSAAE
ncbi:MAG: tonB-system energizer ExbB [Rhodospirillales bacterium]|nr:tonB-system energizer ExbB [Rhodospirillales bacterium]